MSISLNVMIALTHGLMIYSSESDLYVTLQIIGQGFFLLLTATFYGYLLYLIRKESKKFDQSIRHGSQVCNITLTRTIMYICIIYISYKLQGYKKFYILDGYTSLLKFVHRCIDIFVQRGEYD